mmetsp:Transcript_6724/g.27028  ORF Transcript_6724/g.27028 Transcript_6724/m.27028 type:complete len:300 (+) Transcript_6724:1327-2226(+)
MEMRGASFAPPRYSPKSSTRRRRASSALHLFVKPPSVSSFVRRFQILTRRSRALQRRARAEWRSSCSQTPRAFANPRERVRALRRQTYRSSHRAAAVVRRESLGLGNTSFDVSNGSPCDRAKRRRRRDSYRASKRNSPRGDRVVPTATPNFRSISSEACPNGDRPNTPSFHAFVPRDRATFRGARSTTRPRCERRFRRDRLRRARSARRRRRYIPGDLLNTLCDGASLSFSPFLLWAPSNRRLRVGAPRAHARQTAPRECRNAPTAPPSRRRPLPRHREFSPSVRSGSADSPASDRCAR